MIMIVQKIGYVMLLLSLLFLAVAWIAPFTELAEDNFEMREDAKWIIETTLTGGISLLIGGLIAEQLAANKDE